MCIFICTEYKTRAFSALLKMLRWFAGQQIRNTAVRSQPLLIPEQFPHPLFTAEYWRKHLQCKSHFRPKPSSDGLWSQATPRFTRFLPFCSMHYNFLTMTIQVQLGQFHLTPTSFWTTRRHVLNQMNSLFQL